MKVKAAVFQLMLGSTERQAMRPDVMILRGMFDGSINHIEYDVIA